METLDHDYSLHTSNDGDKKLAVVFYTHFLKNEGKSKEEGRAIFDDTVFVKIFTPGDRSNVVDRPLRPTDPFRFPEQYARFKTAQEQRGSGTPLEEWPIITRGQAEELKYLGFSTVEQVAEAKDGINYMGLQQLKLKAKAFLEIAHGNTAPMEKMQAALDDALSQNKIMAQSIKDLTDKVQTLLTAPVAKK